MTTSERLFSSADAFAHPVTRFALYIIGGLLIVAPLLTLILRRVRVVDAVLTREILVRTTSWLGIVVLVIGPILLGGFWAMLVIFLIAMGSYLEYARITGLFREQAVSWSVLIGIALVFFAVLDHWYGLFTALMPLGAAAIAAIALLGDKPKGYVQRLALGVLGFMIFGVCLGHLAYFANSGYYRPLLILILLAVSINDVFAFTCGKLFGRRKLCPSISPNKTIGGALGALLLTPLFLCLIAWPFINDIPGLDWHHILIGGVILSLCGQLGDLMLSAIKRDIGIKDTGTVIPGHGGLLDRVDSVLLAAPASFHFIGYLFGVGLDQSTHILTG